MCNRPYFAGKISRQEFRRRGMRPLLSELDHVYAKQSISRNINTELTEVVSYNIPIVLS